MNKLFITVALCLLAAALYAQDYSYEVAREPIQNGDVNGDGAVCFDDSVAIIFYLWRGGQELPCEDAADVDRSGDINVSDAILSLRHLFYGDFIQDCPIECYPVVIK